MTRHRPHLEGDRVRRLPRLRDPGDREPPEGAARNLSLLRDYIQEAYGPAPLEGDDPPCKHAVALLGAALLVAGALPPASGRRRSCLGVFFVLLAVG